MNANASQEFATTKVARATLNLKILQSIKNIAFMDQLHANLVNKMFVEKNTNFTKITFVRKEKCNANTAIK
jgi:hypothetical protein